MTAQRDLSLSYRARTPRLLRGLVAEGWPEITLTMSAEAASILADDLEFAVRAKPLGRPLDDYAFVQGIKK